MICPKVIWTGGQKVLIESVPLILLLLMVAQAIFGTWAVYKWRASNEQIRQIKEQNEKIERQFREDERKDEEVRKQFNSYCRNQRRPEVCQAIFDSGIAIEKAFDFEGFAQFAVTLGRSEQNYICPSFNCFGMGSPNKYTYKRYASYKEAVEDLAEWFFERGYTRLSPDDFPTLARIYKVAKPYARWIATLNTIWREIG